MDHDSIIVDPVLLDAVAASLREGHSRAAEAHAVVVEAAEATMAAIQEELSEIEKQIIQASTMSKHGPPPSLLAKFRTLKQSRAQATSLLTELEAMASRAVQIDASAESLAGQIAGIARCARDIQRGGMPEPNPSRFSASRDEVQHFLGKILDRTSTPRDLLSPLPRGGPEAPAHSDEVTQPAWWEREKGS